MQPTMDSCLAGLAMRGVNPRVIFDVGAADGGWTKHARTYWPGSGYTLFEPLIERSPELDKLSNEFPGITWHNCGLGRNRTTLELSISTNLYTASFTYGGMSSRQVAVETLDLLLAEGKIVQGDFLKIDVQGFELEVLAGAEKFLHGVQIAIIETNFHRFAPSMNLFHEAVNFMHQKGFRVYEILDQLRRPYDKAVGQCDICFVRERHDLFSNCAWE